MMFETTKLLFIETKRSLFKKIKTSPILYFFFTSMMLFSIVMFAFLTFFLIKTEVDVSLSDVFFSIFFIFIMKSSHDFYVFFVKAPQISYPLSTQRHQIKTIFEIFIGILLGFYWYSQEILFVACTLPIVVLHLTWALRHAMESYLYVNRKERTREKNQIKIFSPFRAFFYRETTVLWRDRLLVSFVFTSVSTALITGYLVLYGAELLIPESLREMAGRSLPSMFVFTGIYIVIIYTSVFPSLNLFLNEEKTMWILRNLPIRNETIIFGKASSLTLCFVTAIPFIAYISIFIGLNEIIFISWFLIFSYIAGVIISVPLGAKYVGKKSDVLLLYSVAMILFVILAIVGTTGNYIRQNFTYAIVFYSIFLIVEFGVLYLSLKLSSHILSLNS